MNRGFFMGLFLLAGCAGTGVLAQTDTIADQKIEEIVITAKVPVVTIKADKMTYHIESAVARGQGSLYEVLEMLPGVMISNDGKIYLNGQSGINVLMDGKQTYLSGQELVTLLKSTPAATAEKIDLITHPSSRYDASGNAGLIDIRTKKMRLRGMNLTANGSFRQGKYGVGNGSLSMNRREGLFNFYLTYSYSQGTDCNELQIDRLFADLRDPDKVELSVRQDSYRKYPYTSHYYRAGIDFFASARTVVGVYTNGNLHQSRMPGDMFTYFSAPSSASPDSMLHTSNVEDRKKKNFTAGVNLTHQLDTAGKVLDASFDYLHFGYTDNLDLHSSSQNRPGRVDSVKGDVPGAINLYTGQVNLTLPFAGKWELEAGAKFSFISIDNEASYADNKGNGWVPNEALSQHFVYDENINAGYIQCGATFKPFYIRAGLRVENTRIDGRLTGGEAQIDSSFTSRYTNLFPSVLLEYAFRQNKLSLFYGRRIVRPNYGDLNPFVYIFDDYTFEQGNTALKPMKSDRLELTFIYKNLFRAGFLYSRTHDVIVKSFFEKDNRQVYVTPMNLSTGTSLGPRLYTGNLPLASFWTVNANVACVYNHYRWTDTAGERVNKRATLIGSLTNQLDFGKGWSMELSGSYNGKMAAGQATLSPIWQVDGGIRKKVLKNNGTIRLFARDIFHSYREKMMLTVPGQQAFTNERQDNTQIGISFTYRFSKGYEVKESRRKSSVDESKRINL